MNGNTYKGKGVALYLRLSREDGDKEVSESILNQEQFLKRYAKEQGFEDVTIYSDDGYSGTNFDRPAFIQLINDIEQQKISVVITKDLSRLGRDYILTGHYIERYFPTNHIRYIAVNDGVDTFEEQRNHDMTPFKSLFNDMYAKDISQKVRTALTTKRKDGIFIGSFAPYGYKKDPQNKGKLLIDGDISDHVKKIFELYLSGETLQSISTKLTEQGIETPSQVKGMKGNQKQFGSSGVWNDVMVKRILTNPTYIGNLTQNRSKKISYKVDKRLSIQQKDWIVVENTHQPIITDYDFKEVQNRLAVRGYQSEKRKVGQHLLTGIVFCEDCGAPMATIKAGETRRYLVCTTWRRNAKLGLCTTHCINEKLIIDVVREQLKEFALKYIDVKMLLNDYNSHVVESSSLNKELMKIYQQIEQNNKVKLSLYKDKVKKVITEEEFVKFSQELTLENAKLELQKSDIEDKVNNQKNCEENKESIVDSVVTFESIDRNMIMMLIDKIYIGKDKQVTIVFDFKDPRGLQEN